MRRLLRLALVCLLLSAFLPTNGQAAASITSATLRILGDDAYEIWINGNTHTTNAYQDFQAASTAEGCPVVVARAGDTILLGDLQVNVLHPTYLASDRNSNSIVLLLSKVRLSSEI